MKEVKKALIVIDRLNEKYGDFETELEYEEPWQLLLSVLLSAQTTDANVNRVTKKLFAKLKTLESIATAKIETLEKLVYSTGYYRAKAKNMKLCAQQLLERHDGEVPSSMDELIELAGVGRKTANVSLHILYGKAEGIVMDTHIARVTHRLGFASEKNPVLGEKKMMKVLDKKYWKLWGDLLIQHGRETCFAQKPDCERCELLDLCPTGKKRTMIN